MKKDLVKNKKYLIHFFGIIGFLVVPMLFAPKPPEAKFFLLEKPTVRDLLASCLMLLLFYLNYYIFIPRFYFKRQYFIYGFLVILGLFAIAFLPSISTGHNLIAEKPQLQELNERFKGDNFSPRPDEFSPLQEIRHHIFLYAAVIMFSVLLRVRSRLLIAEKEKLQAELANLKAQIHPHFLFNTLNSIYSLAIRKDDKAPETIVKLSEFLRFLLKDANQDKVALKKEINYIENYIDLQKSRLRDSVKIEYKVNGMVTSQEIAPLILFTYIENAFKHGVNPDEDSAIEILITVNDKNLTLNVANNKVANQNNEDSLNIGLANNEERLNRIYSGKHTLRIKETVKIYNLLLELELN